MPGGELINTMSIWAQMRGKFTGRSEQAGAPIIREPYRRGFDREFRLPTDPPYVIRINQRAPKGLQRKFREFVPIAGIAQPDWQHNATAFIAGAGRRVELLREAHNPADPNAVAVIGHWEESGTQRSGKLGYLPADVAEVIATNHAETPIGATVVVMYLPRDGRGAGIRLDLWMPARRPARTKERPYDPTIAIPHDPVVRNLRGRELEKQGLVDNAIAFYEANVRDGFDGNFPYDRLAIIYRRRHDAQQEIAVLERAVEVFEGLRASQRLDVEPKLARFRERLAKRRTRQDTN
jgi:hypothetical protein